MTVALARLIGVTGSDAHRALAARFAEAGAKVDDQDATAVDPAALESRAIQEGRLSGVAEEIKHAFEG